MVYFTSPGGRKKNIWSRERMPNRTLDVNMSGLDAMTTRCWPNARSQPNSVASYVKSLNSFITQKFNWISIMNRLHHKCWQINNNYRPVGATFSKSDVQNDEMVGFPMHTESNSKMQGSLIPSSILDVMPSDIRHTRDQLLWNHAPSEACPINEWCKYFCISTCLWSKHLIRDKALNDFRISPIHFIHRKYFTLSFSSHDSMNLFWKMKLDFHSYEINYDLNKQSRNVFYAQYATNM